MLYWIVVSVVFVRAVSWLGPRPEIIASGVLVWMALLGWAITTKLDI
jgi:hypothetical protein